MGHSDQLRQVVQKAATETGFELFGVATIGTFRELDYFPAWIANGHAGEMGYLESRDESGRLKRASLDRVASWARSVVVCAINYNNEEPYSIQVNDKERGWISRYAWTKRDYHAVVFKKLKQVEARIHDVFGGFNGKDLVGGLVTRSYVDTGPLVERVYAKYAGVGWIGKNTCIINQKMGSWLFLGVILTSLEVTAELPAPDRCGSCTRCIEACPTDAFVGPYQLDATRCISYLTIEKRGEIPEELRAGMGRHVFGCDICQDVCPWNRKAPAGKEPELSPRPELVSPPLGWLGEITQEEFAEKLSGSPVRRAKFSGLRRNVVFAMGNSGQPRFVPVLEKLSNDTDPVVAEHAKWALQRLREARRYKHD